jgi:hypothetical protein
MKSGIKIDTVDERKSFLVGTVMSPRYKMLRFQHHDDVEQAAYEAALEWTGDLRAMERIFWRGLERLFSELGYRRNPVSPSPDAPLCAECGERPGAYRCQGGMLCRRCGMRRRMRDRRALIRLEVKI